MHFTGGDIEADARTNRHCLRAEDGLASTRKKGDRLLNRMRMKQHAVARLEPLLRDEKMLRPIPRRDEMLGGETAGAGDDRQGGVIDAATGRG
jgi:hypothetical protein